MDPVFKERQVIALLLDRCVEDVESAQRALLQQHRIVIEDCLSKELERFCLQLQSESGRVSNGHVDDGGGSLKSGNGLESSEADDMATKRETAIRKKVKAASAAAHRLTNPKSCELEPAEGDGQQEAPNGELPPSMPAIAMAPMRSERTTGARLKRSRTNQSAAATSGPKTQLEVADPWHLPAPNRRQTMAMRTKPTSSDTFWHGFFRHPQGVVHGTFFNLCSAALILTNAIFIGYQTHVNIGINFQRLDGEAEKVDWKVVESVFLVLFMAELGMRVGTDRLRFFRGDEWRWNLFDSAIVGLSIVETVAESILNRIGMSFPFLRLVRVVRVLRVLKVLHMVPFFRRLGLMMTSVSASLSALAPAFVLLVLLIYLFGICIMQGIINYADKQEQSDDWTDKLNKRFGSVDATMKTLFMSVTSGLSWVECLEALSRLGFFYELVMVFYVGFVQICVLNIVTGVFVDTVHQMYRPEREEIVQREISKRKAILQTIRTIFEEADEDGSGTITWEEFEYFMGDENILMYLSSLEIDITQAREIFDLIDCDGKSEVGIDEFVLAFLEMKGAAKGADVAILRNNFHKMSVKIATLMHDTQRHLEELKMLMEASRKDFWLVGGGLESLSFTGCRRPLNGLSHPAVEQPPPSRHEATREPGPAVAAADWDFREI
mmetsp:Transcript_12900/g.29276  ORF Transcript_12900/g.29276 Transcript_12900/m.29276 type:complete len:664 (-) Transcript_12900:32-2023(-)